MKTTAQTATTTVTAPPAPRELRRLLEAGDQARQALSRIELDRERLLAQIASIDASVRELQERLGSGTLLQVQEDFLATQLRRLDTEIAARPAPGPLPGSPGGPERRASPRPAPIPMPEFNKLFPPEPEHRPRVTSSFLARARRVLSKDAQQRPAEHSPEA